MKQNELAESLDISNNHMSSIENGRERPSLSIFIMICLELSVTPDYLLLGIVHTYDIPNSIIESIKLCNEEEIELIRYLIEYFIINKKTK